MSGPLLGLVLVGAAEFLGAVLLVRWVHRRLTRRRRMLRALQRDFPRAFGPRTW